MATERGRRMRIKRGNDHLIHFCTYQLHGGGHRSVEIVGEGCCGDMDGDGDDNEKQRR